MIKPNPIDLSTSVMSVFNENLKTRGFLKSDPLDKIDLDAEYKLILQKKSKLSANQRRRVIMITERKMQNPSGIETEIRL